jgi:ADP-ribosylglycohydrolase
LQKIGSFDALADFQEALWRRPSPPGFPYEEPNDWASISAGFPDPQSQARFEGSDADLADRLLGAWQGRCAGCQLGKPLEGTTWPDRIKQVLQVVGSWPLTDYMKPTPPGLKAEQLPDCDFFQRSNAWRNTLCKGNFDHVAPDDDIHYAIVSQMVLEKHGPDFTSEQALSVLRDHSPISCLWAAGRNMYRTFVFGVPTPFTAIMGNPCRQSLGAQIRCDAFGWAAPGNPALAARMAYKDAVNSQTRNGIYSGIFFAALLADVLAHGDPVRAIDTAQSYVPARSRFAEMIRFVREQCAGGDDWETVNGRLLARYPGEARRFNHSIPNAGIVLLGLLRGGRDFTRALGITVMAGLDTDCTGATAGSILGCALGTAGIPAHWTAPFHDMVHTEVKGLPQVRITELARRLFDVAHRHVRR